MKTMLTIVFSNFSIAITLLCIYNFIRTYLKAQKFTLIIFFLVDHSNKTKNR